MKVLPKSLGQALCRTLSDMYSCLTICHHLQFGVLYEHRASDLLKRMDVINTIVDCIPQVHCQALPCTHCCLVCLVKHALLPFCLRLHSKFRLSIQNYTLPSRTRAQLIFYPKKQLWRPAYSLQDRSPATCRLQNIFDTFIMLRIDTVLVSCSRHTRLG